MNHSSWNFPYRVIAHRGGGTLFPENTLEAIKYGKCKAVEFDVMLSKDLIPMLFHDHIIGRTVNTSAHHSVIKGKWFNELNSSELEELDVGSWLSSDFSNCRIPRLIHILEYCISNGIWMNIELKPVPGEEVKTGQIVAKLVEEYFPKNSERIHLVFSSFSYDCLKAAFEVAPHFPFSYLIDCIDDDPNWRSKIKDINGVSMNVNFKKLTNDHIAQIKLAGYKIFCYTVNDLGIGTELFENGVDAFCTDRIDLFDITTA